MYQSTSTFVLTNATWELRRVVTPSGYQWDVLWYEREVGWHPIERMSSRKQAIELARILDAAMTVTK